MRLARRAVVNDAQGRPVRLGTLIGDTFVEALSQLGPTYVKVGQILGTRADLLPPGVIASLSGLYERLPPVPEGTLEDVFLAEFGVPLGDAFVTWDPTPVASASVATVYRAWLPDGTGVAVKVVRPGIAGLVAADLAMLRRLAKISQRFPGMREMPLRAIIDELGVSLERQLDLSLEAVANRRLQGALQYEAGIIVPDLVERYCSRSILTMEEVPASQWTDAPAIKQALLAVLGALYRMIFVEGFIHCDLHPGNLRLYSDGRAALLDFGFMAEMQTADRHAFAQFFYAMASGDGEACAELALETAASCRRGMDREVFEREMCAIVNDVAGKTARDFSVARFVTHLFALMRRHGVCGTTAFIMASVALLVLEGLAKDAGVDLDFQAEARPYLIRASLSGAQRGTVTSERVDSLLQEKFVDVSVATAVQNVQEAV
jgi:ubiquinone biosynthesis protein